MLCCVINEICHEINKDKCILYIKIVIVIYITLYVVKKKQNEGILKERK